MTRAEKRAAILAELTVDANKSDRATAAYSPEDADIPF